MSKHEGTTHGATPGANQNVDGELTAEELDGVVGGASGVPDLSAGGVPGFGGDGVPGSPLARGYLSVELENVRVTS